MNRKQALQLGIALTATVPIAAFGKSVLRLATIPIDSGAEVFYANATGAFKKQGFAAEILSIRNGAAIVAATLGGSADIGFSNIVSLAAAHERGLPVTIIAPAGLYIHNAPTSQLLVRKDSSIRTAADCNGKIFGVSALKSITQYSTEAWLDNNGGNSKSVHLVEMSFPDIGPALMEGRIDVGHFAEPALTEAKKHARVLADSYDAVALRFLIAAFFTTPTYVQKNAQIVNRFIDVIRSTATWANAHHGETADILAKVTKLNRTTVQRMTRATYATELLPRDIQPSIDVAAKYGGLKKFPARELIWQGK